MNKSHSFALSSPPRSTRWQVIFDGIRLRVAEKGKERGISLVYSVRRSDGEGK